MYLGVNIDHVASIREARKTYEPSPLEAVFVAKNAGADQITIHLREDRRHIHDSDLDAIIQQSPLPVNVECALDRNVLDILKKARPHRVTFVPEKREEVTTEGGLDVERFEKILSSEISSFHSSGIKVSLFIDPLKSHIDIAKSLKSDAIELHTGRFANIYATLYSGLSRHKNAIDSLKSVTQQDLQNVIQDLQKASTYAKSLGLEVYAGHGLNYQNVGEILKIKEITELNIGHSIIARAVFSGLEKAIVDMIKLLR